MHPLLLRGNIEHAAFCRALEPHELFQRRYSEDLVQYAPNFGGCFLTSDNKEAEVKRDADNHSFQPRVRL